MEVWKAVVGFEGQYEVSNLGGVRSLDREVVRTYSSGKPSSVIRYKGKMLTAGAKGCGHMNVSLGEGNTRLVHRLVLEAFVGPAPYRMECLHIDGNPANNALSNLRWGSRLENKQDEKTHAEMYRRKLRGSMSEDHIRQIKRELAAPDRPLQKELAEKYGVHINTINNINRGFVHKWVDI